MAIRTINHVSAQDNGKTNKVVCPLCKKETEMRLFVSRDLTGLTYLLEKESELSFAVCPCCAGTFSVNPNYIAEREKGTTCFLETKDLTEIKKGNKI